MSLLVTIAPASFRRWRLRGKAPSHRAEYRFIKGSRREAEIAAAAWRAEQPTVTIRALKARTPLAVWLRALIDHARHLQPRSRDLYVLALRQWIDPTPPTTRAARAAWGSFPYDYNIGRRALNTIKADDAADFQRHLLERGLSPNTIAVAMRLCRWAFREAMRRRAVSRDPFAEVRTVRAPTNRGTIPEIRDLHAAEQDDGPTAGREGLLIRLAIWTGARRNELLALTWRDIDLEGGRMSIAGSLEQRQGIIRLKATKTASSVRNLPLTAELIAELAKVRRVAAELALSNGYRLDYLPVLPAKDGKSWWSPMAATQAGKRALRRIGVKDASLHTMRHVFATTLLAQRVHPRIVQGLLGHANVATTLGTYTHATPSDDAVALAGLRNARDLARAGRPARANS